MIIGDGPAVAEALNLLDQAQDALSQGDLGRYQQLVDAARSLLTDFIATADIEETEETEGG